VSQAKENAKNAMQQMREVRFVKSIPKSAVVTTA